MGYDRKYGNITTEFGVIASDEPIILFRAQDINTPSVLLKYVNDCIRNHSPLSHIEFVLNTFKGVVLWQIKNVDRVKIPDTDLGPRLKR